ncbi:ABC transporter ATP-binding protein [Agromyces atrinae]|uniref:ABC transporter ATP-binding protein n=1 Tax=Agromyces atrinae TaxID=592376 RepID=UPI001F5A3CBC|nr:ABC transporter ATP-binding protein [Agromyces atrinae]MCI2957697.1 ABC transporter ATP-binding protein [Agromyces atrinae]
MNAAGVAVDVGIERGAFSADVRFDVAPGTVTALLGPNGAGKSTVLRALAGLTPVARGSITIGADVVEAPARGIRVPPQDRPVGCVFQDYLLFPHLSVIENVAFGLRARGVARPEARRTAEVALDTLGLAAFRESRPRRLSGGQAQRVALARALVTEPALLLLDEPLAALDIETRGDVRASLSEAMRAYGGTSIVVTHDPVDALNLADRIVVIEDGRVSQQGTAADLIAAPASRYVARLVGRTGFVDGDDFVSFPADAVRLSDTDEGGGWPGVVVRVDRDLAAALVEIDLDRGGRIRASLPVGADIVARLERGSRVVARTDDGVVARRAR